MWQDWKRSCIENTYIWNHYYFLRTLFLHGKAENCQAVLPECIQQPRSPFKRIWGANLHCRESGLCREVQKDIPSKGRNTQFNKFFIWFLCVSTCGFMPMCVFVCAGTHVCMCVCLLLVSFLKCCPSWVLRQDLSLDWNSPSRLGQLASYP